MKTKIMRLNLRLIVFFFCWQNLGIGQSYIKSIKIDGFESYVNNQFGLNDSSDLFFMNFHDLPSLNDFTQQFNIVRLSQNGSYKSAFSISIDSLPEFDSRDFTFFDVKGDYISISFWNKSNFSQQKLSGIFCGNLKEESFWCRKTSKESAISFTGSIITKNKSVIGMIRPYSNEELGFQNFDGYSGLAEFDLETGQPGWSYTYHKDTINNPIGFYAQGMVEFRDTNLLIFSLTKNTISSGFTPGLIKLSQKGEILKSISLTSLNYANNIPIFGWQFDNYSVDQFNNIYISGKLENQPEWNSSNSREGFVAKFNSDLELLWAKRFSAEKFRLNRLAIEVTPDGDVLFAYSTIGNYPTISGKLNSNGILQYQNGYSFFAPNIKIGKDGSTIFLSKRKFSQDGSFERGTIIAKSTPNGTFENCPTFDACLNLYDFDLNYTPTTWVRVPADTLGEIPFEVRPFSFSVEDYCVTPKPPTPFFTSPDTICQNICLSPDSLNNRLAHGVEWTITGTNTNFQSDDESFNYCFNEPGTYQIEQEVWLLGCSEFYTRNIVVLPDSLGKLLGDDRLLCEDSMAVLIPNGARPLRQFEWNNGSTEPTLNISQSGNYAITATDGFCTASDEVNLTFFKEWLIGEAFEIPKDTTVCRDLLPFVFQPTSNYTSDFFVNGSSSAQQEFSFSKEGNYQISANIEGCEIDENFYLTVEPCEVDIYIPSSFSPNNDGINDFLEPLGNDFTGQKMEVYDRWGGKLFETKKPPFAWDGKSGNALTEEGVYVLVFSYLNLKNNREEVVSGDVLVVR